MEDLSYRLLLLLCFLHWAFSFRDDPPICTSTDPARRCFCRYVPYRQERFFALTVSCGVSSAGFNFSELALLNFSAVFPWTLRFHSWRDGGNYTKNLLIIPANAIPSSANVTPFDLATDGVHLLSIEKGAFAGRTIKGLKFYRTEMTRLPLESFRDQKMNLEYVEIVGVRQRSGEPIEPPRFHSFQALKDITINALPMVSKFLPDGFLNDLPSLESLTLIWVRVVRVSPGAIRNVPALKKLIIVSGELERVPINLLSHLSSLTLLELSNNNISTVYATDVDALMRLPSLEKVYLFDNPFSCTCELYSFINLLHGEPPFSLTSNLYGEYLCSSPQTLQGKYLSDLSLLTYVELNCTGESTAKPVNYTTRDLPDFVDSSTVARLAAPIISAIVLLGIAFTAVVVIFHRKINLKWVGLFRRFGPHHHRGDEADNTRYQYDAYICHHGDMEEFISEQMIPRLEGEPNNFRLCVSFRDFLVGTNKLDNVATAMTESRLVIVLLDANFIASGQCVLELNMACSRMMDAGAGVGAVPAAAAVNAPVLDRATGILLVLLDALPVDALPTTLTVLRDKITCLEWRPEEEERCWQQLLASIWAGRQEQIQAFEIQD
ncbi:toll-like receptor 2 [Acanthaster planci]|uniref:Toll-like receptor 2 n=1 Tax=Acanthaster planci TaxID=133434 RepID=A0A8B7XLE2_ACAPL|nr:toll-like receptor 2 [Acanthaster planci]XP_022080978.1 toll-like receptor 2 [Acanthaster planci]